jgi:Ca-activated chloride channel family protein
MKFLYPQYLKLFFLLVALVPFWLYSIQTKQKTRRSLGVGQPLRRISRFSSLAKDWGKCLLLNLVMGALILALAHPQWIQEKKVPQPGIMDIVFLLDASPSMRASDVQPSRLARALEVIGVFSRKKLSHDRIGLVSFAGGSLILSYLTEDPNNILYYLDYLKEDTTLSLGTNIGRALTNGLTVISKEAEASPQAARNKKVFILVSDGEDHGTELESAVREVKGREVKVHTIGIGSKEGAPIPIAKEQGRPVYLEDNKGNKVIARLDERTLRWIAEETGGKFYRSFSGKELETTFSEIALKEREITGFKKVVEYQDFYRGFLVAAMGIFLATMLM